MRPCHPRGLFLMFRWHPQRVCHLSTNLFWPVDCSNLNHTLAVLQFRPPIRLVRYEYEPSREQLFRNTLFKCGLQLEYVENTYSEHSTFSFRIVEFRWHCCTLHSDTAPDYRWHLPKLSNQPLRIYRLFSVSNLSAREKTKKYSSSSSSIEVLTRSHHTHCTLKYMYI